MRLETAPALYEHIAPIIGNVSDATATEMRTLKLDLWALNTRLRACRGPAGAGAETIFIEGKPVAIIGALKEGKTFLRTWFIASKDYFADKGTLRFSRDFMKLIQASNGNRIIEARTASEHPNVRKWFRLLGFQKHLDEPPVSVYRYVGNCGR